MSIPRRRVPCLLPALALVLLGPTAAGAVTRSWNNPAGGAASTPGNWSPPGVPGPADSLVFDLPGTYPVRFDTLVPFSAAHACRAGNVTFTMASPHTLAGGLTAGGILLGNSPNLILHGILTAPRTSTIGSTVGFATFRVSGANSQFRVTDPGADLRIGDFGAGTLQVDDGGLVEVEEDLRLAEQAGSAGTVSVDGISGFAPSTLRTLDPSGDILVGINGSGSLRVGNGGEVLAQGAIRLGSGSGSSGDVTIGGTASAPSRLVATGALSVAANASAAAAGTASLLVDPFGHVLSSATLALGDPDGGLRGTLGLNGGTVHTRDLRVDATRGEIDYPAGTLRVDGGTMNLGPAAPFEFGYGGEARFELIRGAVGTTGGALRLGGGPATLSLDSGASLLVAGDLEARAGSSAIVLDSSATLTVAGRLHLASSNPASLEVGPASRVGVQSMEMTDGPGGTASAVIRGAGARLSVADILLVGGDETTQGDQALLELLEDGALEAGLPASRLAIRPPGSVLAASGASIAVGGPITIEGRLRLDGATLSAGEVRLSGFGRLEGRGAVPCPVSGTTTLAAIEAIGALDLGDGPSLDGYDFPGTLRVGAFLVRLFDPGSITLGDSTVLVGGELRSGGSDLDLGLGTVLAGQGTVQATNFANAGTVDLSGEGFGTLAFLAPYSQATPGTLTLGIGGSDDGEFDDLTVTGAATLAGTLHLRFSPGAALGQGVAIPLVTASTITGTFANVVLEGYPHPQALAITYTPTQVLLTLQAAVGVPAPAALPAVLAFVGGRSAGTPSFRLDLPRAAEVRIELLAATGRRIAVLADRAFAAGSHRVELAAPGAVSGRLARGVYFGRASVRLLGAGGRARLLSDRIVVD